MSSQSYKLVEAKRKLQKCYGCRGIEMNYNDTFLLISGSLLALTLTAFLAGLTSYPYGWIALTAFFIMRLLYLWQSK